MVAPLPLVDMCPGVWDFHFNYHKAEQVRGFAAELESLGAGSIWVGEALFRDPLSLAGLLLAATHQVTVAVGVASIWSRDAFAMMAAQCTLDEAYPGRFLLGIGVSHRSLIGGVRGHKYENPLAAMHNYLDAMDEAWAAYKAVKPDHRPPLILGALGPRMTELAAQRTQGVHTYLVPPEHTERARGILEPAQLLVPEQAVVLDPDPERARTLARTHVRRYLPLANYRNNLRRLGFTTEDFEFDGSDRLIDSIVVHGDVNAIRRRIQQHRDVGADHVALHILSPVRRQFPMAQWRTVLSHKSD